MDPTATHNKTFAFCLLAALGGCAAGPDFQRPAAPATTAYGAPAATQETARADAQQGAAQRFVVDRDIPHEWWTLFKSPKLDALVKRALASNPDIEAAQAALRQAQAYADAQQGFFYPTVSASYTPSRNKLAGNMGGNSPGQQGSGAVIQTYSNPAGPKYNGPAYFDFHTAQLNVGYVPDVFGLNRRLVESAEARVEAQQMQLEAAYLTLAANVVATAIQEASLRAQVAAQLKVIGYNQQALEIARNQLQLGYISELDLTRQEMTNAQAQQALAPMQLQLEQTRNLLRVLVGNTPDQDIEEQFSLDELQLPEELPLSLPSKLVEQRPDVRLAEAQLHDASAQYGVAIANRLPQFSISGAIGGMASSPSWMFKTGGGFFDLTANIAQTIFDGGTLRARSRAAQENLTQAAANYRSVVMSALQNVADALYVIQSDAQALNAAARTAAAASKAGKLTRDQYEAGAIDFQTLLVAQQNEQYATINLVQAQTNRLGSTAALFQALGGGWWNRPATERQTETKQP